VASNMTQRVAFAVVAIPAALALVWQGGLPLAVLLAVVAWLGTAELLRFARRQGLSAFAPLALVTAAAFPLVAWRTMTDEMAAGQVAAAWPYAIAVWLLAALLATLARVAPSARPLASAAVTLLAPLYAGHCPPSCWRSATPTTAPAPLPRLPWCSFPWSPSGSSTRWR